ncbi:protein of unknown function [Pseudogulbenkiania sp. NH8B]|uniref:DUF2190 family protein n=1 Tax=Pseudogulbenkiania sp. (strain NH8B) TaxID=748280 RepID=UPI0002279A93|nr:DUF2190 family protein [Pseudogulbenkiania sp. NH8B]BAK75813.1 protein of unknown function [Pseudogulbenkiania sp. NH8B]
MRNYKSTGATLTQVATAVTASGDPVLNGNLFSVAQHAAAIGDPLSSTTLGVYELPKDAAAVFTLGEEVWFDPAAKTCGEKAAGKHLIGTAFAAAANGSTSVDVRLNGTSTTVAA